MYVVEEGDLVKGDYPVFCHQVNCQGAMNSGIAKQIRTKYPEVYKVYHYYCGKYEDPSAILGTILSLKTDDGRTCVNMFSQNFYGYDGKQYTDEEAFQQCLDSIKRCLPDADTIAFPYKIGCGLGGGNWETIESLLKRFAEESGKKIIVVRLKE